MKLVALFVLAACGSPSHHPAVDGAPGFDGGHDPALDASPDAAVIPTGPWQVVVGGVGACALHASDGRVKCWGGIPGYELSTFYGDAPNEMGTHLPFIDLGTDRHAKALTVGTDHACAILDTDRVKCWGNNQYGQLGLGDTRDRGRAVGDMGDALPYIDLGAGRTVKAISAGDWVTCAILDTNKLKCWGLNAAGELGLGDTAKRGDGIGKMGDLLPYVDLGTGRTPSSVYAGEDRVCAILDDHSVKCWGNDADGALGRALPPQNIGGAAGQMGDALAPVDLGAGNTPVAIAQGGSSICATLADGRVKCWGRNKEGELAIGAMDDRGDAANEMGDALPFAMLPSHPTIVVGAAGGECAAFANGSVACWGSNYDGSLGLGLADNASVGTMSNQLGASIPLVSLAGPVRTLSAQGIETCATLTDDHVQCWGLNSLGQLGIGDTANRGNQASDMGTSLPFVDLGP